MQCSFRLIGNATNDTTRVTCPYFRARCQLTLPAVHLHANIPLHTAILPLICNVGPLRFQQSALNLSKPLTKKSKRWWMVWCCEPQLVSFGCLKWSFDFPNVRTLYVFLKIFKAFPQLTFASYFRFLKLRQRAIQISNKDRTKLCESHCLTQLKWKTKFSKVLLLRSKKVQTESKQ